MASFMLELTVGDFEAWKSRRDVRAEYGERHARVSRVADEPNEVVVLMEWEILAAVQAFSGSEAFLEGMEEADFVEEAVRVLEPVA